MEKYFKEQISKLHNINDESKLYFLEMLIRAKSAKNEDITYSLCKILKKHLDDLKIWNFIEMKLDMPVFME